MRTKKEIFLEISNNIKCSTKPNYRLLFANKYWLDLDSKLKIAFLWNIFRFSCTHSSVKRECYAAMFPKA
jgi:hypothetical protein